MIEQYIADLFYKFDTLMLPGLGEFVLKYETSSIHPIENKITPPAKRVTFDFSVKKNDGVIANYIADKERIPFFDACGVILKFVEETIDALDKGKQVSMPKIGTFSKAADGNYVFTPDTSANYNLDTFGMEEIVSPPIIRHDIKERLEKQFAEKLRPVKERNRFPSAAIWIIFIAIIGGGMGAAFFIFPDQFSNLKLDKIFRFSQKKEIAVIKGQPVIQEKQKTEEDTKAMDTVAKDTTANNTPPANAQNVQTTPLQASTGRYYIISGSFIKKQNAENYAQQLRQKGYEPKVIFVPGKGMYMVSYNSFAQMEEAEQALERIRTETAGAWILVY